MSLRLLEPVTESGELAEIARWLDPEPVSALGGSRLLRDGSRTVFGVAIGENSSIPDAQSPRHRHHVRLADALAYPRRIVRTRCTRCRSILGNWKLVTSPHMLDHDSWAERKEAFGPDAEPWQRWIVDPPAPLAFRDYWEGTVGLSCTACGRESILFTLAAVRTRLYASTRSETIELLG